jgi:hypothetical protein
MLLNDNEVLELLRGDSALNKARQVFSSYCGVMTSLEQSKPIGPIEIRRLEFEAVQKIKEIFDYDPG